MNDRITNALLYAHRLAEELTQLAAAAPPHQQAPIRLANQSLDACRFWMKEAVSKVEPPKESA